MEKEYQRKIDNHLMFKIFITVPTFTEKSSNIIERNPN
jgi:hypothetical protein